MDEKLKLRWVYVCDGGREKEATSGKRWMISMWSELVREGVGVCVCIHAGRGCL